ncbi:Remodeling and spacing factor 1 [Habropoda laboriosa]|uniref:Remodeling and spacing factor 1 n=1 Tax=Habropoda laboriosa TaxID=597456 RepID=A0A0L7QQU4_9HYME|nr:Remodeling and spacing factor 1 [Habropoda laboriosa]
MASDNEASCASDPNFAVICSFLECFGKSCGIIYPDIARLQEMLENTQEVPQQLIDLHIKLLRKTRKTVSPEKWERALVKFCHTYSNQDGWELERFGYKKARIAVKLRLLKVLLETQFDLNQKFKNEVNKLAATELRVEPLGRDKTGLAYWYQLDEECNIRVYREDLDEENWELVAKDREGVVNLINTLSNGEIAAIPINEDSNSLEISEKPIIDTGQISISPSLEDETMQENGIHAEGSDEKDLEKSGGEDFEDERELDDTNEGDNAEDDMDGEDEITNDESSKQNTEEEDSQQTIHSEVIESNTTEILSLAPACPLKTLNGKVDSLSEKETISPQEKELNTIQQTMVTTIISDIKPAEIYKSEEHTTVSSSKVDSEESIPLKSIETPVITSPLKLINVSEIKQFHEEKMITGITPIGNPLNITKKHKHEDTIDSIMKPLDKLSSKSNFPFVSMDMPTAHSKLSVKPIDQLAANLVRMQSEKLEKPSGAKSLEKIAENLARSGSIVGNVINGDDDRLPQDFCARGPIEKPNVLREHRGMDLSTSPRGWESANEQNRPMDFSGIDLSSRKFNKSMDLPSPGYRTQDFQHREMDLSTKKLNKPEVTNLSYDARAVMMRNHAMVADLSKRQMSFPSYEMSSAPYHNATRIPSKDDHRLPNYTILPDPSKITALRMNATPVKRPLEADDMQQDMLKRIRADVIPIRGSMDKRPIMSSNWRDEVGEAIEEPMMMIQGEGSGSDCDAVNPGLGEAVEEPIIFFYGEGSGEECQTGNPGEDTSADNKESNESKNEADSATSSLSPNKNLTEDSLINEVSAGSLVTSKSAIKLNRNYPQSSVSVRNNCQTVGSTQEKSKFKPTLGIQIIPKNSSSPIKRLSRWDVGKPEEKPECDSSIISNEEDISQKKDETECEDSSSENQDIKVDGNSLSTEEKQCSVSQDSMQCDSSISLCQADTSETLKFCTEITPATHSLNNKDTPQNVCDSDSISSHETNTSEKVDNECKPVAASPPRFFFGPNCISYTSRSETFEPQSDHTVSTTIESKSDTLQYECVSSSKQTEDMITSYKSDNFGVTQMNNNSLKVNSYTPETSNPLHENDNKNKVEKIEGPTNTWEQTVSSKYPTHEQHCTMQKTERNLPNSESKEENFKPCAIDIVQDSISSSENTTNEYIKPEKTQMLDVTSQPHSTNDLNKENMDIKPENVIVTPSTTQYNSATELMEHEMSKPGYNSTSEVQLQSKKCDLQSNIDKAIEIPSLCSEDEGDCKPSDTLTLKENELETDSMSANNSCSSSFTQSPELKTQHENNFAESDSASRVEFSIYQEVDSSAGKEIKHVSEKESDSSVESHKRNDKNDNIPEFHNQEKRLISPDNENMKSLIGSNTHSVHSYNKDSKKIEISQQNEISGDSEETKEETFVDSFIKSSVPDINTELGFTDNSTVTSSESVEQCNKDALVPTISSSDDAGTHDASIHESVKVQPDSEKSSFKDECPIYNVLPETVPDANNFKPSKSDAVEVKKEMNISNIVQTATLEDRSSCVDQDLNKDMIIDDKLMKSDEPLNLNEEKACSNENLSRMEDIHDVSFELCSSSDETNKFGAVPEKEIMEDINFVDIQQKSISEDDKKIEQDKNDNMDQNKDAMKQSEKSNEEYEEQTSTSNIVEDTNNKQQENVLEKLEIEELKLNQMNTNSVNSQEPSKIKQSLVANYESSDSNDGSDDVFETTPTGSIENKDNLFTNLEETMTSNNDTESIEEQPMNDEVLSNELQNTVINNQQIESTSENNIEKEISQIENNGLVQVTEKVMNALSEQRDDSQTVYSIQNEIETHKQTKEDIEFNDINNEITCKNLKEQSLKPLEEKLMTSLDNDIKFIKAEGIERVAEELPIMESYNKLKEFSEFSDKGNKFDMHLHGESNLNKDLSDGGDTNIHPVRNILPLDKFDNISSGVDKSEIYKNNISTMPKDIKSMDNSQFVNFISDKSENLDIMDNHEKQNESLHIISKAIESLPENSVSNLNDSSAIFNAQETASKSTTVINDFKKEASKRLSDVSDIQDVPPLKSKPPYVESNEQILEDLTISKVQLDQNLDSFKQVEMPICEAKISEDIVSDSTIEQLAKNEYNMMANTTDNTLNEVEQKHNVGSDEKNENSEIQSVEVKAISIASDDSMGVDNENLFSTAPEEMDPLACTDDDTLKKLGDNEPADNSAPKIGLRVKPVSELTYDGWKLDSTVSSKVSRKRRNSSHESNSEDMSAKQDDEEMMGGKRIKLRSKRMPDRQLRKSVEESRVVTISSDDEAVKCNREKLEDQDVKDVSDDQSATHSVAIERKGRGRPRGRWRRGYRGSWRSTRPKHSEIRSSQTSEISPDVHLDETPSNNESLNMTPISQKKRKKRKMVLGLEIGRDIVPEIQAGLAQDETPVRQSRRIAQLKIKEEADRRRIEEETSNERKDKKDCTEKKKRKKQKPESEEEIVIKETEKEKKSKKKRRKRKKKKMLAKFNEANPWQSSSGSSSDDENENDEDEDEEEEIESEGSLLFKSDHEFSPESDLEKDQESEPLRRARTAQKAQSDVEEADDEYACQKCSKADHPEWILLCDSCDKGWHCSCLRPALMLIPEGDWFCPPCQHNLLVTKLRESLKTYDQLTKRHENEVLRKKRLAFVGISLDNVLHKNEAQRHQKGSKTSSQESDNESSSASSSSSSETSSSEESEPVYQLRERRCANRYKFNDYDAMINAAIQDEVEAVQGAGNQGRGKDIATIVNAEKEEAQDEVLNMEETPENKDDIDRKSEKDSDEEYKMEGEDGMDEEEEEHKGVVKKLLSRKKHRKLNSLDISSEDDPESDEDFKGTSSDDEEDFDDHMTSSDESTFADVKRRGKKGDSRSVRRSTRARTTRYDEDFINDDSEESDRPKRKKSRSTWDSDNEDSDNSWRQRKKKSRTIPTSRYKPLPKTKSRKKKKRKRIIESDNQSENDESNEEPRIETSCEMQPQLGNSESAMPDALDMKLENINENNEDKNVGEIKDMKLQEINPEMSDIPAVLPLEEITQQKKKKENAVKTKKTPTIRRKIIYGGLPDENKPEEEEILSRRTRGRKINYQEEIASDSEEELKKALRRTGESEDEFVVNEGEDLNEDAEKDSDSGDIYNPKKDGHKFKNKSPKNRKPRKSKSPSGKRRMLNDGTPKQRKKPGPKPGSKNRSRKQSFLLGSVIQRRDDQDGEKDIMVNVMDNPIGEIDSKIDDNLSENVGLSGTAMSVAGSFTGDVPEGSLTGLGAGELAELDDEQLEQMMMEDEEYGRRQLELAAIEIAKKKKKEDREAKKLEKARLKALEILAAERQRDPNAPDGTDGDVPKKKKRGRRSKAEILAEQMRRDGAPNLNASSLSVSLSQSNMSSSINPNMSAVMTPDAERTSEGHIPMMTGPDGHLFNLDGSPMKPKRRGRGKGKKTLALEAARAAEAAAKAAAEAGLLGIGTDSNSEIKPGEIPNVLPTPGSSTSGSAPSTPPAGVVTTQGPPSSQTPTSQSVYPTLPPNQQSSVITRMLQSQPVSSSPQSFSVAAAAMGHKYFGGPNAGGQMIGGPRTGYEMQPRGRIPSPYRQAGQSSMPPHFAAVRSGTPPMRMRVPGSQMYHTPHHPMDPSPSGGGPISINNRDRSSPLGPGPAMIPPAAGSPLAKGGPTPPPPPPYVRGAPPMSRFADNPMGPRHQMPPFTNASPVSHNMQQPSPPPNRPPGNFSPYHPPPPPNYHYGAYPPPPPMSTADDAAAYQGSPYPADHFSSPADNQPPIQAPPPPQPPPQQQAHPNDAGAGNKQYDEEGSGEFGGLVSYFSSQREDDLDS